MGTSQNTRTGTPTRSEVPRVVRLVLFVRVLMFEIFVGYSFFFTIPKNYLL